MKYLVTAKEMQEYDNNTIERIGILAEVLMERAALAVRDEILRKLPDKGDVLVVAGSGNNGGDGLALARLLTEEGYRVTVCMIGNKQKATGQFLRQLDILKHYPVILSEEDSAYLQLERYVLEKRSFGAVVDAVFGVGLSRAVEGKYATAIQYMNQLDAYKLAVDIPSGICADTGKVLGIAFAADATVTFGFAKRGHFLYPGSDYTGQLTVADIGITKQAFFGKKPQLFTYDEDPLELMPQRDRGGNKGTFGKVLIVAGFEQMAGAAILCAKAALRMGAGMVKVLCPQENRAILQTAVPEVMYGACENAESSLKWADVVAIGPGMGRSREAADILQYILSNSTLPLVADADAVNLISETEELRKLLINYKGSKILTPHAGELSRLVKEPVGVLKEKMLKTAVECAEALECVMVCKDARTVVAAKGSEEIYLNVSGNNGMATAGSGDVLTGMIAGLLAQKEDAFRAATAGVYLHGLAGDLAEKEYSAYGVTAMRILKNINGLKG